jgi:predicted AlkP superfamily phosphohydrolase/phosphomutase
MKRVAVALCVIVVLGAWIYLYQRQQKPAVPEARQRVFLIGLDGASWNLMGPALKRGKLPNLQKLIETGSSGPLKSLLPTHSPVLWTSIATGKTQKKHGIQTFTAEKDGKMIPVSGTQRITKAFWNIFSDYGLTVGVVNWWVTWPPEKVNGYMISDRYRNWNPHRDKDVVLTYPPDLLSALPRVGVSQKQFQQDRLQYGLPEDMTPKVEDENVGELVRNYKTYWGHDKAIRESCRRMLDKQPVDVFAVVFRIVDVSSHTFSSLMDQQLMQDAAEKQAAGQLTQQDIDRVDTEFAKMMEPVYVYADEIVGDFLKHAGNNANVVICSDHGFTLDKGRYGHAYMDIPPDGIVILNGPAFRKGSQVEGASLLDITPTLLYLEGMPMGRDMDGRALFKAFNPAFLKTHTPTVVASHDKGFRQKGEPASSEMDQEILNDLKSLGYIQ